MNPRFSCNFIRLEMKDIVCINLYRITTTSVINMTIFTIIEIILNINIVVMVSSSNVAPSYVLDRYKILL